MFYLYTLSDGEQIAVSHKHVETLPAEVREKYRPAVVIEPTDRAAVQRIAAAVLDYKPQSEMLADWEVELLGDSRELIEATDAIQSALREFAAPTPPKPEEPQGLGAVVEDDKGARWVRITTNGAEDCWKRNDGRYDRLYYDDIAAVRVVHEGVTA